MVALSFSKMETQFDIPEVEIAYMEGRNYEVINLNPNGNLCVVYFSSNGLYYPNNSETFREVILEKDRYEWKKNILKTANKIIFLRDVKKQWYIEGINRKINTIEKLSEFLKSESLGLDLICIGSSAGGYAATLFGCLLSASHVFSFAGQFSLHHHLADDIERQQHRSLVKYENDSRCNQYYCLSNLIQNSGVPIFYLYPAKCRLDILQSRLTESIPNVYAFPFDSSEHAKTCLYLNFADLFHMDLDELFELHQFYLNRSNKVINKYHFSNKVSGYMRTAKYLTGSVFR